MNSSPNLLFRWQFTGSTAISKFACGAREHWVVAGVAAPVQMEGDIVKDATSLGLLHRALRPPKEAENS